MDYKTYTDFERGMSAELEKQYRSARDRQDLAEAARLRGRILALRRSLRDSWELSGRRLEGRENLYAFTCDEPSDLKPKHLRIMDMYFTAILA